MFRSRVSVFGIFSCRFTENWGPGFLCILPQGFLPYMPWHSPDTLLHMCEQHAPGTLLSESCSVHSSLQCVARFSICHDWRRLSSHLRIWYVHSRHRCRFGAARPEHQTKMDFPRPEYVMRSQLAAMTCRNMMIMMMIIIMMMRVMVKIIIMMDGSENDEPCHDADNDDHCEHHSHVQDTLLYSFHSSHFSGKSLVV